MFSCKLGYFDRYHNILWDYDALVNMLPSTTQANSQLSFFLFSVSSTSTKSLATDITKIKALEDNIRSLQLGLMEHLDDLTEFNDTLSLKDIIYFPLKMTEAGYNALRDDLNMTKSELLLITDNITLTTRLEYIDAVLTRLTSALNRTNTGLARLKSTQAKEKVIYHQTMTPSWLEGHASYISIYSTITTEQLTFTAGSSSHAALFNVPMIPANVLQNYTQITVKIVVSNDVKIGTNQDSDPKYGVSDGISFVGFETSDRASGNTPPCFGIEESSGTTLTGKKVLRSPSDPRPRDSFYPGQFVITLKLDAHENWGSCYTAHDGGFVKTAVYNKRLILSNGLTLEGYRDNSYERYGIKVIEVTIVEDV
ncbi:hypothetical protein ACROYT_G042093 [Oculina patagonica]